MRDRVVECSKVKMGNPVQAIIKEGVEFFLKFAVGSVPVLDKENTRFLLLEDVTKNSLEFKRLAAGSKFFRKAVRESLKDYLVLKGKQRDGTLQARGFRQV